MEILKHPNPLLNKKAKRVTEFNEEFKTKALELMETLELSPTGIGLASTQVGWNQQVIAIYVDQKILMVNPFLLHDKGEEKTSIEGCLSLPGKLVPVKRKEDILVEYQDIDGVTHRESYSGLEARCILHEMDHLKGILIIDK